MNRNIKTYENNETRNRREVEDVGVRKMAFQAMILDLMIVSQKNLTPESVCISSTLE
jgi:hypothetical protein